MTTIITVALVLVGVALAGWLALIAYDIGHDFSRFSDRDAPPKGK